MTQQKGTRQKLIARRNSLYNELLKAHLHFELYWQLYKPPEELANIRNKYITFFYITILAHSQSFCLAIYNVTKDLNDTGNIPKLLRMIEADPNSDLTEAKKIFNRNQLLIKQIQDARTNFVAHDLIKKGRKPIIVKEIERMLEMPCTKEEGELLLADLKDVFAIISRCCEKGHDYAFKVIPSPNTKELLSDLNNYKAILHKQLKELRTDY